ncbi:MAG: aldehyde dehydrogenase family protein, partial [Burkholderiaceae bacterium]|nr:aldehyde dehydrogenase family protein [Burkholderiaceae bacterium]
MLQSIEARTGQPVGDAWPESSLADIHRAAHTAAAVAGNFAASSAAERASLLRALAAALEADRESIVALA